MPSVCHGSGESPHPAGSCQLPEVGARSEWQPWAAPVFPKNLNRLLTGPAAAPMGLGLTAAACVASGEFRSYCCLHHHCWLGMWGWAGRRVAEQQGTTACLFFPYPG